MSKMLPLTPSLLEAEVGKNRLLLLFIYIFIIYLFIFEVQYGNMIIASEAKYQLFEILFRGWKTT
jgi:hypothetical protein